MITTTKTEKHQCCKFLVNKSYVYIDRENVNTFSAF